MYINKEGFTLLCEGIQSNQYIEEINVSLGVSITEEMIQVVCQLITHSTIKKLNINVYEVDKLNP